MVAGIQPPVDFYPLILHVYEWHSEPICSSRTGVRVAVLCFLGFRIQDVRILMMPIGNWPSSDTAHRYYNYTPTTTRQHFPCFVASFISLFILVGLGSQLLGG